MLRSVYSILPILSFLVALSCSPASEDGERSTAISREAFIEAYVALRVAAIKIPGEELSVEERDRILATLGLADQDLLDFVEVNGRDVQFMRRVWEEVDSIITEKRQLPTSPGKRGA